MDQNENLLPAEDTMFTSMVKGFRLPTPHKLPKDSKSSSKPRSGGSNFSRPAKAGRRGRGKYSRPKKNDSGFHLPIPWA